MRVNQYKFEHICSQMEKEFGKIRKGEEEKYTMFLFPMESNLLKVYRKYPSSNSRRLLEAISLVLFHIESRLTGEEYDLSNFKTEDNDRLVHALLMSFDPFVNEEIKMIIGQEKLDALNNKEELKSFYTIPVMCILRIKESVETFGKHLGANGYFDFIEENMGELIQEDDELKFSIAV